MGRRRDDGRKIMRLPEKKTGWKRNNNARDREKRNCILLFFFLFFLVIKWRGNSLVGRKINLFLMTFALILFPLSL